MEYLELPVGFFLGIFACLIAISVLLFITALISVLFLVSQGAECRHFHYLIFKVEKELYSEDPEKNGHYVLKKKKYTGFPNFLVLRGKLSYEEMVKKDSFVSFLIFPFVAALTALMIYLTIIAGNFYLRMFLVGTSVGCCLYLLIHIKTIIDGRSDETTLRKYTVKKTQEFLQAGLEAVDLPPLSELSYEKANDMEKLMYLNLRYVKAQIMNDLPVLAECAHEIENLNINALLLDYRFHRNAMLMDYYSFRERNALKATEFYEASKEEIEKDMDCNGRRKLAYYKYYVLHDVPGAKTCVEQGLEALKVIDPSRTEAELKFEENMLLYLKGVIENET
jgi:hypothetical protein